MDTGVEYGHAAFGGRVAWASCFSGEADCPNSATVQIGGDAGIPCTFAGQCYHGTHVAGIAAGQETPSYTEGGVADETTITSIRVFHLGSCSGNPCPLAYDSDILAGLNFAYDYRSIDYAAVNISIGGGQFSSNCDAAYASIKTAIDNLRSVNIATAIASGNNGFTNSVNFPGCISTALTIGATNNADGVAGFSNSNALVDFYALGDPVYWSVPGGYGNKSRYLDGHAAGGRLHRHDEVGPGRPDRCHVEFLGASGPTITDSKSGLQRHRIKRAAGNGRGDHHAHQ